MTPIGSRLKTRLDARRRWFVNEWFFKWHFIGKEGPVSIESLDGRGIHLGGLAYCGSARTTYWDTLVLGVRQEIDTQFAWLDGEVRKYNGPTAERAIDECAGQLISFVRSIRRSAVKKDRILRGDGINFPPEDDAGLWDGTSEREIIAQADALKSALPKDKAPPHDPLFQQQTTFSERALVHWNRSQWWLGPLGITCGVAGLLLAFVGRFPRFCAFAT